MNDRKNSKFIPVRVHFQVPQPFFLSGENIAVFRRNNSQYLENFHRFLIYKVKDFALMEEISLQRIRELLLAIHYPVGKGVEFDTEKAPDLGYSAEEIAFAERIIPIEPDRTLISLFKREIIFCNLDKSFTCGIVYIAIAKIIFIIEADGSECDHIFEEDLETKVAEMKNFVQSLDWTTSIRNDCYGNNI